VAFQKHKEAFGRLDICINCAGIGEKTQFLEDYSKNGTGSWRQVIDVNLIGVINCTRIAVRFLLYRQNMQPSKYDCVPLGVACTSCRNSEVL
jgi:NAD(P)-dependent dehydrogenase (short-subunit alcohol dehydrogenase family)